MPSFFSPIQTRFQFSFKAAGFHFRKARSAHADVWAGPQISLYFKGYLSLMLLF